MLTNYTIGIFQTQDELQARRVLGQFTVEYAARFTYRDGWYEVLVPTRYAASASYLNGIAKTVANTDIKPQGLQTFREVGQWR